MVNAFHWQVIEKARISSFGAVFANVQTSRQACAMGIERNTSPVRGQHIENLRLLKLVSGQLRFQEWEQDHLHTCEVCQGVLYVLVDKHVQVPAGKDGSPPGEAA